MNWTVQNLLFSLQMYKWGKVKPELLTPTLIIIL